MRIDLTDTTFIIPVRIDSMIRLENLLMSVDSIVRYFRTRILILEASSYQNEIIPSLIKDDTVKYTFLVDKDPVFYKTKYLNILTFRLILIAIRRKIALKKSIKNKSVILITK